MLREGKGEGLSFFNKYDKYEDVPEEEARIGSAN